MFICERCGYRASYKCNMKTHYNRKWPCKPMVSDISFETLKEQFHNKDVKYAENTLECKPNVNICKQDVNIYECDYCDKTFKYRQSKCRHQKKCPKKKESNLLEYMSLKMSKMEADIVEMKHQHAKEIEEL